MSVPIVPATYAANGYNDPYTGHGPRPSVGQECHSSGGHHHPQGRQGLRQQIEGQERRDKGTTHIDRKDCVARLAPPGHHIPLAKHPYHSPPSIMAPSAGKRASGIFTQDPTHDSNNRLNSASEGTPILSKA
jgi:hypothetical protein